MPLVLIAAAQEESQMRKREAVLGILHDNNKESRRCKLKQKTCNMAKRHGALIFNLFLGVLPKGRTRTLQLNTYVLDT